MPTFRVLLPTVAAAIMTAACSASSPSGTPDASPAHADPGFGHIHGIDLNPADGLVYVATHTGVFQLGPDGSRRIADRHQDTMGFVIAGPDRFLASGHPDLREPGPQHLGLILSTDRAQTWTTVALRGEADFHALTVSGSTVYGFDSTDGVVMRSDDDGQNWQRGATLNAAGLDIDPANTLRVLATTPNGLLESMDGGMTFAPTSAQPPRPLIFVDHVEKTGPDGEPVLAGIDEYGAVWALGKAGWNQTGTLSGPPQAFTVLGADRYLAATGEGVFKSEDAGRTWILITSAQS